MTWYNNFNLLEILQLLKHYTNLTDPLSTPMPKDIVATITATFPHIHSS